MIPPLAQIPPARPAAPDAAAYEEAARNEAALDAIFAALADPTRRAILARLRQSPAAVGEIAAPFEMSQPAVSKHLKVLERAGLITRAPDRQRRLANLNAAPMRAAALWLTDFAAFWEGNLDALGALLDDMQQKGNPDD